MTKKRRKKPKSRNPVARDMLTSGAFRKRVVEDKRRKKPKHPSTQETDHDN